MKLTKEVTSSCCWAAVTDSWLCFDCKEHCSATVYETLSVRVLDYYKWRVLRLVIDIEYDEEDSDRDLEISDKIENFLWHTSFEWLLKDWEEIDFEDLDLT